MHATTLSSAALMIWKTLKQDYGLNADQLFLDCELDPRQVSNPGHRYPDEKILKLWETAFEHTGDECFGLKVAMHIHPTTLHALGFAWLSSPNLLDALQRLVRFYRIVTDAEKLELESAEHVYVLKLVPLSHLIEVSPMDYDTFFAALLIMCQAICGTEYRPAYIKMQRPEPACLAEMNSFFQVPIEFNQVENEIGFYKTSILDPLPAANALLARENDQIMMRFLSQLDKNDVVMQVKSILTNKLPAGDINEKDIADALHISTRTLQRKLNEQQKSFKEIIDETRRELAIQYVREVDVPMTEITFLLGYSEQANFTRAFKRWTGQSPSEFRKAS